MKYRKLGNSGIEISVIGHGTWQFGNDQFGEVDENLAIRAIRASVDAGINLIDTAAAYGKDGESELTVGKAIKNIRDKVVLSTKVGVIRYYGDYIRCLQPKVMRIQLETSLKRLQTDYLDLYFIHWPDYNAGIEDALAELVKMKCEGKIRAIGVSNFNIEQINKAIEIADISAVQPPLSLLDRSSLETILPFCSKHGIGTITYGSLGGGILAGKLKQPKPGEKEFRSTFYPYYDEPMWSKCQKFLTVLGQIAQKRGVSIAEVSVNWVLSQAGVTSALIGAATPEKAMENAKAVEWEFSNEDFDLLRAIMLD